MHRLKKMLASSALLESVPERLVQYAELLTPLLKALCFATESNERGSSAVPNLLFPRSPAAVLWRIAFVVVDAIKGCCWRSRAHVFVEQREVRPSFTHTDTSPPVLRVGVVRRRKAAPAHLDPSAVLGTSSHPVSKVCGPSFLQTSAGFGPSVHDGVPECLELGATIASEKPAGLVVPRFVRNPANRSKAVEGFSGAIKWLHGTFIVNKVREIESLHNRRQFERDWCLKGLV